MTAFIAGLIGGLLGPVVWESVCLIFHIRQVNRRIARQVTGIG